MRLLLDLLTAYGAAGLGTYVGIRAAHPLRREPIDELLLGIAMVTVSWPLILFGLLLINEKKR